MHQAIRSGALAGEHLAQGAGPAGFDARWRASPGGQELKRIRNFKPGFKRGLWFGLVNSAWEMLTCGKSPWTLKNSADWQRLERLDAYTSPERHWGERTLPPRDRVSFVFFAGNAHEESQPVHLKVADTSICATRCATEYGNPCERFCPAGVYEMVDDGVRRPAPADQRRQLRALQGLRYQGPLRDHHLDHARGRLGTELPVVVGWRHRSLQ